MLEVLSSETVLQFWERVAMKKKAEDVFGIFYCECSQSKDAFMPQMFWEILGNLQRRVDQFKYCPFCRDELEKKQVGKLVRKAHQELNRKK